MREKMILPPDCAHRDLNPGLWLSPDFIKVDKGELQSSLRKTASLFWDPKVHSIFAIRSTTLDQGRLGSNPPFVNLSKVAVFSVETYRASAMIGHSSTLVRLSSTLTRLLEGQSPKPD